MVGGVGPKGSYLSNFRRLQKEQPRHRSAAARSSRSHTSICHGKFEEAERFIPLLLHCKLGYGNLVNGYVCEIMSQFFPIGSDRCTVNGRKRCGAAVKSIASFKRFSASKASRSAFYNRRSESEGGGLASEQPVIASTRL